jgi:hypothetical protein
MGGEYGSRLVAMGKTNNLLIRHKDLKKLFFGDQHVGSAQFFTDTYGQYHTIPLERFPHYIFLTDHLEDPYVDHIYEKYLANSWNYYFGKDNTRERRIKQIKHFINMYRWFAKQKDAGSITAIEKPITITPRPDGNFIILDGNHRASIALKLGLDIMATCLSPKDYIQSVTYVPEEFWGAGRLGMPYQSVFDDKEELVRGRRPDIYKRYSLMKKKTW